ncbi:MAG: hypothetical protein ACE5IQ_08025 [Candidatus Methylomirabilales bacterium]
MQPRVIEEAAVVDRRFGPERRREEGRHTLERRGLIRRVADRVPQEIRRDLEGWQRALLPPEELFEHLMDRLAASLAHAFTVRRDEVAVLLLKDHGQLLRFAYPLPLYAGRTNLFPVRTSSIAGKVLLSGRGRIDNDVAQIRHLEIYERIRGTEKRALEIQKMVTVPLLLPAGQALGVLQVSRRGRSSKEVGADFPPFDLLKLKDLSRELAPDIHRVIPAGF